MAPVEQRGLGVEQARAEQRFQQLRAEVIAPLLGFFAGPPRLLSYALLVGLMLGIQATGNWGLFNIGYILLCTCLLDTQSSLLDWGHPSWAPVLWTWPAIAINGALLSCS